MKPVINALLTIEDDAEAGKTARASLNREAFNEALEQLKPSAWLYSNPFERKAVNEKLRTLAAGEVSKKG